jgi:hypothetical protein
VPLHLLVTSITARDPKATFLWEENCRTNLTIHLPDKWDQRPRLPSVFRVCLPESRSKRPFLNDDAHYVGDASECQKRDKAYPIADRNAEPEKRHKRAGVRGVAKILVWPGRDQPLLLPHDHASSKEMAERLNRPKTKRNARPNERYPDRNRPTMHSELRQNKRHSENA